MKLFPLVSHFLVIQSFGNFCITQIVQSLILPTHEISTPFNLHKNILGFYWLQETKEKTTYQDKTNIHASVYPFLSQYRDSSMNNEFYQTISQRAIVSPKLVKENAGNVSLSIQEMSSIFSTFARFYLCIEYILDVLHLEINQSNCLAIPNYHHSNKQTIQNCLNDQSTNKK